MCLTKELNFGLLHLCFLVLGEGEAHCSVCVYKIPPLSVEELQRRNKTVQTASSLGLRSHFTLIYIYFLFAAHSHTNIYKTIMYTRLITDTRNLFYIYALFSGVCFIINNIAKETVCAANCMGYFSTVAIYICRHGTIADGDSRNYC